MPDSGITPRRALAWIHNLPIESAFVAARQGGAQFRGWGVTEHLLAGVMDAIRENTYVTIMAAGPKKKPSPPKPIERPKKQENKKTNNLFAMMAANQFSAARKAKEGNNGQGTGR